MIEEPEASQEITGPAKLEGLLREVVRSRTAVREWGQPWTAD